MTYNAVDNETVRNEADFIGWSSTLHNVLPEQTGKATTGGGSVAPGAKALFCDAGTTTGDRAGLNGIDEGMMASAGIQVIRLIYQTGVTPPYTDDCVIGGWLAPNELDSANDFGAGLDLTNGEYRLRGTTVAATLPADQFDVAMLEIEIDDNAGETRFKQSGAVEESAVISATPGNFGYGERIVSLVSNGSGDPIRLKWVAQGVKRV